MIARTRRFTDGETREIRARAVFEAGKLDSQTYDEPTVAPFALRLAPAAWRDLAARAEAAVAELHEVERALGAERRRWRALGIPRKVRGILASARAATPHDARFCRIDFHPTAEGWRASEINADVPGGFIEAGALTRIVAERFPTMLTPPDPAAALADAVGRRVGGGGHAALVHATSYTDDQQVMRRIGAELASRGVAAHLASPGHVAPTPGGRCRLATRGVEVGAIVRFFPGEWLANLPRADRARWSRVDAGVAQSNPLSALLIQGKRLPLVARELGLATPVWSDLLPEVKAIGARRFAPALVPAGEVLKPTWGRIGEGIAIAGVTPERIARRSRLAARVFPGSWLLQRRFESMPVAGGRDDSDPAPVHACLGVYVIDGRAAGIYARVAPRALIDGRARDAAVLLDPALDLAPLRTEEPRHAVLQQA